jgi:hypothetical protein
MPALPTTQTSAWQELVCATAIPHNDHVPFMKLRQSRTMTAPVTCTPAKGQQRGGHTNGGPEDITLYPLNRTRGSCFAWRWSIQACKTCHQVESLICRHDLHDNNA